MTEEVSVGQLIRQAREAKGLTREELAKELKLPLRHLEAIEGDHWEALPPGRPRPLARQLAARLDADLEYHTGAFQVVPGVQELEPPDPRQEQLERTVMGILTIASLLVVLWLVVPGPSLGRKPSPSFLTGAAARRTLPPPPKPSDSPYPVLGEFLPEAPLNEQGVLVSLRALDGCKVRIETQADPGRPALAHSLQVSEPWRLRVKGPFTLFLDNAGVVNLEVAGVHIAHERSAGEPWTGQFDEKGRWLRPPSISLPIGAPVPDDDEDEPRK
jgi:transcriptional regulator with XRE-family HTH domain